MASGTNRERVLEALRISARPLDDDQLSARTGIQPRQTVNQVCRSLEREGLLNRYIGPDNKIVNERAAGQGVPRSQPVNPDMGRPRDHAAAVATPTVDRATDHAFPPGSSDEQRGAERVMLDLVGLQLGVSLEPATLTVPSGARVEVDGADTNRTVLVECWAHQGAPKSAQKHKVHSDALKLTWISSTLYPRPRLVLCLSDPAAAVPFLPGARSWAAQALQDFGITVVVVDLPDDVRQRVLDAQRRQYR